VIRTTHAPAHVVAPIARRRPTAEGRRPAPTIAALAALAALSGACVALAQTGPYPNRPIRFIVPYPPGGSTDIIARAVGGKMAEAMNQQIVVDNRGGANTIVGTELAARSQPDGYTILLATATSLVINPVLYRKLPYDAVKDLAPITRLTEVPYVLVANPGLPANTVKEFIALAKQKPNSIAYASTGNGSTAQLGASLLEQMAGIKLVHVPYKGNAPGHVDIISGQVQFTFTGLASIHAHVKAGRMKLIAVAASKRLAVLPDLPTIAESGFPGFWNGTWFAVSTRAGVPRPIVLRLHGEIVKALRAPDVKDRLESIGYELLHDETPEAFAKYIAEDTQRWAKVARDSNIRLD